MELENVAPEAAVARWEEYSRDTESESEWNGRLVALQPQLNSEYSSKFQEINSKSAVVRWEEYSRDTESELIGRLVALQSSSASQLK